MSLGIIIYSKYSNKCSEVFEIIKSTGIDFTQTYNIRTLCIDNDNIRKNLINNKKIELTVVPTLLIVFSTGIIEKYEGNALIEWFISKVPKDEHDSVNPKIKSPQINNKPKKHKKDSYVPQSLVAKDEDSNEEEEKEEEEVAQQATNIDDLSDEEDIESLEELSDNEDTVMIRDGPNGFKKGKFNKKKPTKTQIPNGSIKNNTGKVNVAAVIAQAQAQQKKRDKGYPQQQRR